MTTAYTSLLGLALPVTGELSGTWGDTVNTAITSLLDTAVAGTTSITTDADITLTTTTGASNQARQAIILWNPASGTVTRNITAPAQSKIYVVINASGGTQSIVIRGVGPTTGVTIAKGESATVAWNGSDFVKVSSSGGAITFTDLTVTGNTILGDAAADTLTVNATSTFASPVNFTAQVKLPSTGRSAAAALTPTNPAFLYGVASTYTDTTSSGTLAPVASFYGLAQPTLSTSNVTTYTTAATLYIANAPATAGSATITNPYALYSAAGANYFGGNVVMNANLTVDGTTLFVDSTNNRVGVGTDTPGYPFAAYSASSAYVAQVSTGLTGSSAYTTVRFDQADTTAWGYVALGGNTAANAGLQNTMGFGTYTANSVALITSDSTKFKINSATNAILGTSLSPSAWSNVTATLELGTGTNGISLGLYSNGSGALFVNNLYYDGSNWKYSKNSDYGALFNANDNGVGRFAWYTVTLGGASAKDTVATLNRQMILGQNGLLTLGDTTYAWTSAVAGIDLRNYGGLSSDSSYAYLSSNIYYDGANKRKTTGGVGLFGVGNGGSGLVMHMQYAGSGAADSTISFSTAFAVDTSGNFGIKTTSMGAPLAFADAAGDKIQFNGSNANQYKISLHSGGTGDAIFRFTAGSTAEAPSGAGDFQFYTGTSQKFGINARGAVCIGPELEAWGAGIGVLEFSGTSRNQGYIAYNATLNPKGYIYSNLYYDGANNRYANTGSASVYEIDPTYYQWWFVGSGTAGNTATLVGKARLNASGYLGLNGQLNPRVPLQLGSTGGQMLAVYDDGGTNATRLGLGIDLTGYSYELSSFIGSSTGAQNGQWTFSNWNSTSNVYTRVAVINQNGIGLSTENPTSGVGIKFPASQSASSNANTLDDYEEGDWTPRLSGAGGGDYTPGGINSGRYVKIGKIVYATCSLQWTAQVTAYSGNLWVTGLPFNSGTVRSAGSMGAIASGLTFTSGYGEWNYLIDPGYNKSYIIQNSTTGAGYSHSPNVATTGLVYSMTIIYETDN